MNPQLYFWLAFAILVIAVAFLTAKYGMLRDMSLVGYRPYSWSRVQLAWWTVIVLSAFIAIVLDTNKAPTLSTSTVILLGISAATSAVARTIDVATPANIPPPAPGTTERSNMVLDILSDQNSVSIPRFQTVVFNLVFGIWFITSVLENLVNPPKGDIDLIMPGIATTNLVLLGLSSATYAALKTTENKTTVNTDASTAPDTANFEEEPVG